MAIQRRVQGPQARRRLRLRPAPVLAGAALAPAAAAILWPRARARVVVTIDGRPYAGFADRATAEEAVKLWSGEVTGGGIPISSRPAASGWPAVRGRTLGVVER